MACRVSEAQPPKTAAACCPLNSVSACALARALLESLLRNSSCSGRPNTPPCSFTSSTAICRASANTHSLTASGPLKACTAPNTIGSAARAPCHATPAKGAAAAAVSHWRRRIMWPRSMPHPTQAPLAPNARCVWERQSRRRVDEQCAQFAVARLLSPHETPPIRWFG